MNLYLRSYMGSYYILSFYITSSLILSWFMLSYVILSYLTLSYLMLYFVPSDKKTNTVELHGGISSIDNHDAYWLHRSIHCDQSNYILICISGGK